MDKIKLLQTQKNSIFEIIKISGFNPSSFKWNDKIDIPSLEYRDTDYFIEYYLSDNPFRKQVIVSPGERLLREVYSNELNDWNKYLAFTSKWLVNLERELNSPNYWDKIRKEGSIVLEKFGDDTNYFVETEKVLLIEKIGLIKADIKSIGLDDLSVEQINSRLDHITELLDNLNKTDWFSILIGSFISLFLTLIITPDKVDLIWKIIKTHFENWLMLPK